MRLRFSYLAVIALLLAAAQAASAGPSRPQLITFPAPLVPYVAAIVGNAGDTAALLREAQDSHHLMLSPSQIEAIEGADILIIPDLGMSPFIAGLAARRPSLRVIELSKLPGANPLPYPEKSAWLATATPAEKTKPAANPLYPRRLSDFGESTPTEAENTAGIAPTTAKKSPADAIRHDPHFWLDPERMATIAPALAEHIGAFSPGARATYIANAHRLALHLRQEVIPNLKPLLAPHHARPAAEKNTLPYVASHASYQYFLTRFGLPNPGELSTRPDEYMGAATMAAILDAAHTTRIRCLMVEVKSTLVEQVAKTSGARIIAISPEYRMGERPVPPLGWLHNEYDRLLYDTAKQFGDCL